MTKFIDFYFDFSSPYAYIGYKEIKKLEKKNPFKIKFMPIFLGGLHNAAGITPAAFIKLKSKYMIEDTKLVSKKKNKQDTSNFSSGGAAVLCEYHSYFDIDLVAEICIFCFKKE